MGRIRTALARLREWMREVVLITRGGVAMVISGFVIFAVFGILAVLRVEHRFDDQVRDLGVVLEAVAVEALEREYATCLQAVEGRQALRETMIDLYDGVAELGGDTADVFAEEQRALLDERRPPLSSANCVPPPDFDQPSLTDGDD